MVDVKKIDDQLQAMTVQKPVRKQTKQQIISYLASRIRSLRAMGYDWQAIVDVLHHNGLEISVDALKTYLTRAKKVSSINQQQDNKQPKKTKKKNDVKTNNVNLEAKITDNKTANTINKPKTVIDMAHESDEV